MTEYNGSDGKCAWGKWETAGVWGRWPPPASQITCELPEKESPFLFALFKVDLFTLTIPQLHSEGALYWLSFLTKNSRVSAIPSFTATHIYRTHSRSLWGKAGINKCDMYLEKDNTLGSFIELYFENTPYFKSAVMTFIYHQKMASLSYFLCFLSSFHYVFQIKNSDGWI